MVRNIPWLSGGGVDVKVEAFTQKLGEVDGCPLPLR
jgi:hypothetical protein